MWSILCECVSSQRGRGLAAISDACLGLLKKCKASQTVWYKAGLLAADVFRFMLVRGLLKRSESTTLLRNREWVEVYFAISEKLIC